MPSNFTHSIVVYWDIKNNAYMCLIFCLSPILTYFQWVKSRQIKKIDKKCYVILNDTINKEEIWHKQLLSKTRSNVKK